MQFADPCILNSYTVLLEAPFNPSRRQKNSVLLTVDLTKAVADEAIERRDSIVIAYRTSNRSYPQRAESPPTSEDEFLTSG